MLNNTSKWSHTRGNTVVPSRWQVTSFIAFLSSSVWCTAPRGLGAKVGESHRAEVFQGVRLVPVR